MIQEKYILKKKSKFLFAILFVLSIYSCKSQEKENPKTLGSTNFDIQNITFKEDVNTLFGKNKYYKTSIKDDNSSDIAYNYIVSKKENQGIKVSLGNIDISKYKYDFKISKDNKMIGISTSFVSKEDIKDKIIQNIDNQFKNYKVNINQLYENPTVYRWEAPEKIIQFTYSSFEGDNVYNISIVNKNFSCDKFPLEKVFVGEDICLKNYTKK
ncbi:hypothetical protein SAMN05421664_1560 [Chryseobacterium soldanellicola]|uniref:Lipoprotein n=1 Tax=Chryseobacterium soldanellicola TaxID=311333 RepID=A0A1H1AS57_9FLAO|nr:hypothetical protein SAMN05421664_1560 [Chryseobacterium soldanellicola]